MFALGASGFEQGKRDGAAWRSASLEGKAKPADMPCRSAPVLIVYMRHSTMQRRGIVLAAALRVGSPAPPTDISFE